MVETSGKSTRQIAREIGRSDSFVRTTIAQGSRPRIDTFVLIANACGYEVAVKSDYESLKVSSEMDGSANMQNDTRVYYASIEATFQE